ncbi:hypothetical protein FLA_2752 [Filimonas lacunae]|nr:hypothetical protein FLA_2752 [Filimonas lacunae]
MTNHKNGIIRYKLIGFEDDDDAAVEELTLLMEQARPPS